MAKWVKKWDVDGSNGNVYVVSIDDEGNYGCSCPVWKFKRKTCKHITYIMDRAEAEGLQGSVVREAQPGNVGEVTIDGDIAIYPLSPLPVNVDFVNTIIYDLLRAGVELKRVEEYRNNMFKKKYPIKDILFHVKTKGRLIYSRFVSGKGWVDLKYVPCDTPLKGSEEAKTVNRKKKAARQAITDWQNDPDVPEWF